MRRYALIFFLLICQVGVTWECAAKTLNFRDSTGQMITLSSCPERVVSLVPGITEIIMRIGAGGSVVGITYYSELSRGAAGKTIVGGFLAPSARKIAELHPDLIFYVSRQRKLVEAFRGSAVLVDLETKGIDDAFRHIKLLGAIFGREKKAAELAMEERARLALIRKKVSRIPGSRRLRVMRIMGRKRLMAPGDDSFQNDFIRAAGGIPPEWGRRGSVVPVTLDEWKRFNAQAIYGCGGDSRLLDMLKRPGWNQVDAVKNGRIYFFPCELTCRAASHVGYFVQWLSSWLYEDQFSKKEDFVLPECPISEKSIDVDLSYVKQGKIIKSRIKDFINKTLLLEFTHPMSVVSSLEGERTGISFVGNHYFPPPSWGLEHRRGLKGLRSDTFRVLGLSRKNTSMLFTGANMDNLAIVRKSFRDITVYALVTAGVMSNAQRMSRDRGNFYEPYRAKNNSPGTINIIILANARLSSRAMTRAIITATEAKTAALSDLDIRSTYTPVVNQATGTGTDNIIVVQGEGPLLHASGGHTKLGELIARAVYQGVRNAIARQNGLLQGRSIFQRLKERKISLFSIARQEARPGMDILLLEKIEGTLMKPEYSGFMQGILAVSDAVEHGSAGPGTLVSVDNWCRITASRIAGHEVKIREPASLSNLPVVLRKGLGAIVCGCQALVNQETESISITP